MTISNISKVETKHYFLYQRYFGYVYTTLGLEKDVLFQINSSMVRPKLLNVMTTTVHIKLKKETNSMEKKQEKYFIEAKFMQSRSKSAFRTKYKITRHHQAATKLKLVKKRGNLTLKPEKIFLFS